MLSRYQRIYLDYAASTPVDPEVERAMRPYFWEKFGNPGSLHSFGQEAMAAVDESREKIAKAIGADFREIIFTGSATEANNLALRGITQTVRRLTQNLVGDGQRSVSVSQRPRLIISAIEHESVLETARDLERDGVEVVYLPVDRHGIVDLKKLEESLNEHTVLVSVMYANNEIGTIQPICEISEVIRKFRDGSMVNSQWSNVRVALPLLHTDAAQAFQFLDCDVNNLRVDLMTLSAHKIYGPKGIGALYARQQIANRGLTVLSGSPSKNKSQIDKRHALGALPLAPLTTGGGQEFGLRPGTENVPNIVGFAKATELLFLSSQEHWDKKIMGLRDYLWQELKKVYPSAELNGDLQLSLPNILSVYFPNHKAEELLTKFDLAGLAASSGSACRSRAMESSYVIEALGHSKERTKRSIRFSLGRPTTREEIARAIEIIKNCL